MHGPSTARIGPGESARSAPTAASMTPASSPGHPACTTPTASGATNAIGAQSAPMAFGQAGIRPEEIDIAMVYDSFTITVLTCLEDLGFCKKGDGAHFIGEGRSSLEGDLPVNPSGGLKSSGHPIGASGVRMIYEITTQLRQQAGSRQVHDPKLGLVHNLGGPGSVACVVILGQQ